MIELSTDGDEPVVEIGGNEVEVLDASDDYVLAECSLNDLVDETAAAFPEALQLQVHSEDGFGTYFFHELHLSHHSSGVGMAFDMNGNFVERPEPMRPNDVEWQDVKHLTDAEGRIWVCLPMGCEHQMFEIVNCHECGRPAQWIGVGDPFGDGQQYLLESEAWCYWCFPREHFNEDELRLARQAEWARKQTTVYHPWPMDCDSARSPAFAKTRKLHNYSR